MQDGIPVTSLSRTLLDNAHAISTHRLQRLLERAEELRIFDLRPVESLLDRCPRHPGAAPLERALDLYRPPPFTRSEFERRFLRVVSAAGLPPPATGFNVAGYELDAYWPQERLAVELDTFETHGSREAFEHDRQRDAELKLAGVEVIHITSPRLEAEPRQVIETVSSLLAQRTRRER